MGRTRFQFLDDAPIVIRWLSYVKFCMAPQVILTQGSQVTHQTVPQVILTCHTQVNHHCLKSKTCVVIGKQLNSKCKHMDLK